ncbi:MAG: hypothetical protein E7589_05335 [Ruminococcaceae bacterium]|nr:hypothetical protein [Oscillospiraceae bacterium]
MKKSYKNIIGAGVAALILVLGLTACSGENNDCEHIYYGDCDARCHECGEERTVTVQHDWQPVLDNATCNDREACRGCGAVKGDYIEHIWLDADCHAPKTCKTCGDTEGDRLDHDFSEWDYNDTMHSRKCVLCGDVNGENRAPHVLRDDHTCECGYKPTQNKIEYPEHYEIELFNSAGKPIKTVAYTTDGEYLRHVSYIYDGNGYLIRQEKYNSDEGLLEYFLFENNDKGQAVQQEFYNGDGECERYQLNEYNAQGWISRIDWYLGDGTSNGYSTFEYDENGVRIGESRMNAEGVMVTWKYDSKGARLSSRTEWPEGNYEIHEYDTNENIILVTSVSVDGSKYIIAYEYNADNKKTKSVSHRYDKNGTLTIKTTETYDERGNAIEYDYVEYYPEGDIVRKQLREFDESGLQIKETDYYNGELSYVTNYIYNEYRQEISTVEANAEGEITRTTKTEYYDNGNRKSYIRYFGDSDVIEDETYYYENGIIKTEKYYDQYGVLSVVNQYDEEGNPIEEIG